MSHPYFVGDGEIESLFYLKEDSKIANYLGIAVERVSSVRTARQPKRIEPRAIPLEPLPEPLEEVMAQNPLTPESVHTPTLCPTCGAPVSQRLMVTHIQALVAAYYKVPVRDMLSARRHRAVTFPRQVAMYLAYELTPKSLPDIGRRFGRDHTTVIHAIKVIQRRILEDAEIDVDLRALRERLAA